jgi:uncharacterized protein
MKRKIYYDLLDWKNNNSSQSLLVKGPRQVGKTYVIKKFGQNEFENVLYLNFEDQVDLRKLFEEIPNPEEAIKALQAYGISKRIYDIDASKTLIFLDEIQLCKRMYSLMKPLTEMKQFRIIASGSLLGINLNDGFLDPGPTVKHIQMNPMDFEEYLWALRGEEIEIVVSNIKSDVKSGKLINSLLHDTFNDDIKDYILIGGMPDVVQEYIQNKDLAKVFLKQQAIVDLYRNDIQQYQSTQDNKIKTLKCFDSIPKQFSKDNHRFMFKWVEEKKDMRYFGQSIDWLERTGNTFKCYHVEHLRGTLLEGQSDRFKLYMVDVGLLVSMMGQGFIFKLINNQLDLFKGAIYEQLVAQMLMAKGIKLHYMRMGDHEIDFLFEHMGNIYPIECKSGGNTKSKSVKSYVDKYQPVKAFKLSMNNVNTTNNRIKALSHYLFSLLTMDEIIQM